ncbi:UNC5C-like protein [Lingula anatina]|uniref:Netrin receptor UNC5 n=1 Tax=Lingula anatina TaxID=7574 RepID=A0A1S3JK65_LINAN|nr:UNC5C-like protein [Lingula anatina]XP_013410759.1 UNC5C-like protein [Lingula anatina]XP_013410760.1 UNC5C-like protein [Lingula anatina]XP_013410761.1 UNC5C-like protein [Lingula anatina]XP_013410762.1 UNC5C-like protein [Lingula anatina]XP_013410763.1 UNC5C-like protein [Lingula anatina]|eukprot:XP_013410758.1 UNC5C-like protein [Lingula anatina]
MAVILANTTLVNSASVTPSKVEVTTYTVGSSGSNRQTEMIKKYDLTTATTSSNTPALVHQGDQIAIISSAVIGAVVLIAIVVVVAVGLWLHRRLKKLEQQQQQQNRQHNGTLEMQLSPDGYSTGDSRCTEIIKVKSDQVESNTSTPQDTIQDDLATQSQGQAQGSPADDLQDEDNVTIRSKKVMRQGGKSFTAYFGHSRTSIFGDIGDFSQLFPLCQDYFSENDATKGIKSYQEKNVGRGSDHDEVVYDRSKMYQVPGTNSVTEVPIEEIFIQHETQQIKTNYDNSSFVDDEGKMAAKAQRPMSMDFALKLEDPEFDVDSQIDSSKKSFMASFDHRQGMFAKKSIGRQGGEITLHEVKLTIPPNALEETKDISVGIIWNKTHMPKLTKKQALLSPVVVCEPHGIRFTKPVTLSIPHCAIDVRSAWNIQPMMSPTSVFQGVQWAPMTIADYDSRLILSRSVSIELRHFTLYTVIGESAENVMAAKSVRLVAFAPPLEVDMMFKIRVYCINNYKEEMKMVRDVEGQLGGKRLDAPMPMFIHDNGQDVCLEMLKMSEGWKIISDTIQKFSFEHVWHSLSPCCMFVLKQNADAVSMILCEILSYQEGNDKQKQKLTIAEELKLVKDELELDTADLTSTSLKTYSVFPHALRSKLVIALDPSTPLGQDWHMVASRMGLDYPTIVWLESRIGVSSPTGQILRMWEKQNKTLQEFHRLMIELERLDVAAEVEKYLVLKESPS